MKPMPRLSIHYWGVCHNQNLSKLYNYQIIKYISCEGRYNIVYGYYFIILHELRYGMDTLAPQKLNIPYFLLQSLIDSNTKVKAGNSE